METRRIILYSNLLINCGDILTEEERKTYAVANQDLEPYNEFGSHGDGSNNLIKSMKSQSSSSKKGSNIKKSSGKSIGESETQNNLISSSPTPDTSSSIAARFTLNKNVKVFLLSLTCEYVSRSLADRDLIPWIQKSRKEKVLTTAYTLAKLRFLPGKTIDLILSQLKGSSTTAAYNSIKSLFTGKDFINQDSNQLSLDPITGNPLPINRINRIDLAQDICKQTALNVIWMPHTIATSIIEFDSQVEKYFIKPRKLVGILIIMWAYGQWQEAMHDVHSQAKLKRQGLKELMNQSDNMSSHAMEQKFYDAMETMEKLDDIDDSTGNSNSSYGFNKNGIQHYASDYSDYPNASDGSGPGSMESYAKFNPMSLNYSTLMDMCPNLESVYDEHYPYSDLHTESSDESSMNLVLNSGNSKLDRDNYDSGDK